MHYNFRRRGFGDREQALYPAWENAARRAAPSGMQQGDRLARYDEVDGNAVGDGDGEQHACIGGDPAVDAFDASPADRRGGDADFGAVDLIAQHDGRKPGDGALERPPPGHHFADRRFTPEPEIESAAGLPAPSGDPRDDAVVAAPGGEIEARGMLGDDLLGECRRRHSARSISAPSARRRSSMRS